MYAANIAQTHSAFVEPSNKVRADVWKLSCIEGFQRVRGFNYQPQFGDRNSIVTAIRNLQHADSLKESYVEDKAGILITKRNFNAQHPPFYYAALAFLLQFMKAQGILWQLAACRLFSIALGGAVVILSYATGKTIWKESVTMPVILAALVSFQPMVSFSFSTITNVAMEIALYSTFLHLCVRAIDRRATIGSLLLTTLVVSAGLLTKLSFLAVIPLSMLPAVYTPPLSGTKSRAKFSFNIKRFLLMLSTPLCISWFWYHKGWTSGGSSLVHLFPGLSHPPPFNIIHYLCHYSWWHNYSRVFASYWGSFGFVNAHLPVPFLGVLTALSATAAIATGAWLVQQLHPATRSETVRSIITVGFFAAATLILASFYACLDMIFNARLGGWFTLRGQYYLAPIIAQFGCLIASCQLFIPRKSLMTLFITLCSMMALNFYTLLGVLGPRCFGSCCIRDMVARAALYQPVSAMAISILITLLFFCSAFFLLLVLVLCRMEASMQKTIVNDSISWATKQNRLSFNPAWPITS